MEDLRKVNAVARYNNPLAAGVAPKVEQLKNEVARQAALRTERLGAIIEQNVIKYTKPTLDTIVVPDGLPLENMLWKCKDDEVRRIVDCERRDLLDIIKDLTDKVCDQQKKLSSLGPKVFVDTVASYTEKKQKEREEAALSLLK